MALCADDCLVEVPSQWDLGCDIETRDGGVKYIGFFSCNWAFGTTVSINGIPTVTGPITDYTAWELGVHNKLITISPIGDGEKTASTFGTQQLVACNPPAITSQVHNISFLSYSIDPTNLEDRDYWHGIRINYTKYRLFYWDCNDIIYYSGVSADPGFSFSLSVLDYIIPKGDPLPPAYYQADLSFRYKGIVPMIQVTGINTAFETDVRT